MKKLGISFSLIVFTLLLFSGCKKDKEPSNTEKITGYTWYITAAKIEPKITVSGQITPIGSLYDMMEPCFQDDKTKFSTGGSYEVDKGNIKCNAADQSYSSNWAFKDSESKLYIENYGNTGEPITFTITELSTSIITLTTPATNTAELRLVLQAYGLEYLLGTSKSVDPTFSVNTKFTLVLRAL